MSRVFSHERYLFLEIFMNVKRGTLSVLFTRISHCISVCDFAGRSYGMFNTVLANRERYSLNTLGSEIWIKIRRTLV